MEDFALDKNGDVIIQDNKIVTVSGTDLIAQKVRQVLKTNLGEWWLNENEGIDFTHLLTKSPNVEAVEDTINFGLRQIDETFRITDFKCNTEHRTLKIEFTAVNDSGENITIIL